MTTPPPDPNALYAYYLEPSQKKVNAIDKPLSEHPGESLQVLAEGAGGAEEKN